MVGLQAVSLGDSLRGVARVVLPPAAALVVFLLLWHAYSAGVRLGGTVLLKPQPAYMVPGPAAVAQRRDGEPRHPRAGLPAHRRGRAGRLPRQPRWSAASWRFSSRSPC